jgi:hypothetical protein
MDDKQLRALLASLAARDRGGRGSGLSRSQVLKLIREHSEAAAAVEDNGSGTPELLLTDNASTAGRTSLSVGEGDECYLHLRVDVDADTDQMTITVWDGGVEVLVLEVGTADNDSKSNPLISTYWARITNGAVDVDVEVTNGTPTWTISKIRNR